MVWRLLDTGFEPLEKADTPTDTDAALREARVNALQNAVIESVLGERDFIKRQEKIMHLRSIGLIDTDEETEIEASIVKRFKDFFGRTSQQPERWHRHLFFEAAKILVATGVLRLNTCRDWQVNRKNPAENVGVKNFETLENMLWKKYGEDSDQSRFYHLHSGSGDNSGVYLANRKRDRTDSTWRHVGFGNKLYAPIETLIGQFMKPMFRDRFMNPSDPEVQIVMRILTEAIQKRLHEKWYSPHKGVTEQATWSPATDHQDLNEILRLLKNPRELLAGINFPHAVSMHVATYELSGRFTGDKKTAVSDASLTHSVSATDNEWPPQVVQPLSTRNALLGAYTTLMELSGMPKTLIEYERTKFLESDAEHTLGRITTVLQKVRKIRGTILHTCGKGEEKALAQIEADIENLLPKEMAEEILRAANVDMMITMLEKEKLDYVARMKWIRGAGNMDAQPESAADITQTKPEAESRLTTNDRLLSEERTLQWTLDQIRNIEGPIPKKLKKICDDALEKAGQVLEVVPDPCKDETQNTLEHYLRYIQRQLDPDAIESTDRTHEVFERFFEPEFVSGIERGDSASAEASRWHLLDATSLGTDDRIVIHDVPESAYVRANYVLVEEERKKIPGTDYICWREGTSIIVDGAEVATKNMSRLEQGKGGTDFQTAFALEITTALDLNERPYAYLRNFVPGNFEDITKKFPAESFSLISAIRSDSHIGDDDFAKLSANYVKLLRPGGVVITDGIEESYSQVVRLLESIPNDEAKIEVVMSVKTHRPIALMIQKAHKNGYLTETEKCAAFQEHVYCKSPEDIAHLRPDLEIRRDICHEIRAVCGHGAFQWVADQVLLESQGSPSRLEELITAAVVGQKLMQDPNLVTPELKRSIARHIVQRHTLVAGNPQPQLLGDHVERPTIQDVEEMLPDLRELPLHTVWSIREAVMKVLDPDNKSFDVHQAIERCIVNAFCDEQIAKRLAKTGRYPEPKEVSATERRQETAKLYDEGRNIAYRNNPTLTAEDISYIQRRTADRAFRAIDTGLHTIDPEKHPLRKTPGVIHQFRRKNSVEQLPDIRTTLLRDNHEFATPEASERLDAKILAVRDIARALREKTGHAPIGFIQFTDCVTNDLLSDRLREIFGESSVDLIERTPCEFITRERKATIDDKDTFRATIEVWGRQGNRLILGGGSWKNAFEAHGELLKKMLGDLFLQTFGNENIRMFGICFFNQILGDMVGALPPPLGGTLPAKTEPGPLEIGLSRITPTGDGKHHPLFQDCSDPFTGTMSHGGYLKGANLHEHGRSMKTLARSSSGGTAAWESFGGKVSGIQWHPEARCAQLGQDISDDSECMLTQLMAQIQELQKVFDCDPEDLRNNFNSGRAQIKGDAGTEILVNALHHQLSELRQNLR